MERLGVRLRWTHDARIFADLPPGFESFETWPRHRRPTSDAKKSPHNEKIERRPTGCREKDSRPIW